MPVKRIGIYSGTFDPIHDGHMAFALESIKQGLVDHVVFLPEPKPRGKSNVTNIEARLSGIITRINGNPQLSVELLPIDTFTTSETLPVIQKLYPSTEISLLIGSDVAKSLLDWPDIEGLKARAGFIIGMRSSDQKADIERALTELDCKYSLVNTAHSEVSSSQFRSDTTYMIKEP